jgi:hypothetical protein
VTRDVGSAGFWKESAEGGITTFSLTIFLFQGGSSGKTVERLEDRLDFGVTGCEVEFWRDRVRGVLTLDAVDVRVRVPAVLAEVGLGTEIGVKSSSSRESFDIFLDRRCCCWEVFQSSDGASARGSKSSLIKDVVEFRREALE